MAKVMALRDASLKGALRDWHASKGCLPDGDRHKKFDEWLRDLIRYIADQFKEVDPEPVRIVKALEVNAIGDKMALYLASHMARERGMATDTNCYMEEGVVFSNVWLKGDNPGMVKTYAVDVANRFRSAGYSAEIWVDEEDDHEVTINAQIDFDLYMGK
jgi:hypothetical protein